MHADKETKIENNIALKAANLTLPRRAAGHKMTVKVPILHADNTISDARQLVIEHADELDTINYVYIVSKAGKVTGVVNIKDVFISKPTVTLSEIMERSVVKAHVNTDYERVAHMALKNNIKAVPLIDKENHLVGVLPSDQVLSIVENEAREDLMKMSGIIMGKSNKLTGSLLQSPFVSFLQRVPWIIVGLIGGLFTASVIKIFDGLLQEHIVLASFIPLVAYVANAVGSQTQTVYIRDIATQPHFSIKKYALKQLVTALMIGLTCFILLLGISYIAWLDIYLGIIVGISIIIAIIVSTSLALLIPRLLMKFDLDPATGSGPFSTVVQDLLSILIYLFTASVLL